LIPSLQLHQQWKSTKLQRISAIGTQSIRLHIIA
jgi:hypothetical protein